MTRWTIGIVLAMLAAAHSQADDINWIFQHNDHFVEGEDDDYEIFQVSQTVVIHRGEPGQTFQLEARFGHWEGETWIDAGEGDINLIQADENAGEVEITVMALLGEEYGAQDVRAINLGLDTETVTGTIAGLKVRGDVAEDGDIAADTISGSFGVPRGRIIHDVRVEWLAGEISCVSLGNLYASLLTGSGPCEHTGSVTVNSSYTHTMTFCGPMTGRIAIHGGMSGTIWGSADIATMIVDQAVSGGIQIGRDLTNELWIGGSLTGSITIQRDVMQSRDIYIGGDLCDENGDLSGGHIIINGSLMEYAEIVVAGSFAGESETEFIAIDYDGWHESDYWHSGATVWVDDQPYSQNTPSMHIWHITGCKGDMNNDRRVDALSDPYYFSLALNDPQQYEIELPGLAGSMVWHGDMDCHNDLNGEDEEPFYYFIDEGCMNCTPECQYAACRADLVPDGVVDLADLSYLLGIYGCCVGEFCYDPDADFDESNCIDLPDLSFLLAVYGLPCDCHNLGGEDGGGGGDGSEGAGVSVAMEAYDTNGSEGDGFAGERDHFVFDLTAEVLDDADDWTASGVAVRAENGATFRLAAEPTVVDPLASFICAPQAGDGDADTPDAGTFVAGAFFPVNSLYDFEPGLINLCWCDRVDSLDGPAAVMRLVIDVSEVEGADTSGGFGSVYFSKTGPANPEDILVAEVQSETGHCFGGCNMHPLSGSFYVKGQ